MASVKSVFNVFIRKPSLGAPVDSSDLEKEIVLVYSITQVRIKRKKEQPEDKRIIWTII